MMTSPSGKRILTACEDHSLRLWNTENYEGLALFAGHTDAVVSTSPLLNSNHRLLAHSSTIILVCQQVGTRGSSSGILVASDTKAYILIRIYS